MTEKICADDIALWLADHPDFLADHPHLLQTITVPHATEGTSLIEYQVSVLQDKVQELKGRLRQYHETAAENENLLARIHNIQLELMQAESLVDLLDVVHRKLVREFGCQKVVLALFDPVGLPTHEILLPLASEQDQNLMQDLVNADEPVCGRLRADRLSLLFGEAAPVMASAAVATLDRQVPLGVLALGSEDEHRFHPGMGTLFLSLLAQTLGRCLALKLPEERQQSA